MYEKIDDLIDFNDDLLYAPFPQKRRGFSGNPLQL